MYKNNKIKVEMLKQMDVPPFLKQKQNADNCTPPTMYCTAIALILFCAVLYVCVDFKFIV